MVGIQIRILGKHLIPTVFLVLSTFCVATSAGNTQSPGIQVQLKRDTHLSLNIMLTSGAQTVVKVSRDRLPWEAGGSLMIIAARSNGQCLKRNVFVQDPTFDEISVDPSTPLTGDIDLERLFPDIVRTLKTSDVQVFWAYEAADSLQIPHWAGGWILIPQQK